MFMGYLRKDSVATVIVGPFVDATDGFTPETSITLATSKVYKHNSVASVDISGLTFTHLSGGTYSLALTAAETSAAGRMVVQITSATNVHRPLNFSFMVLAAAVYDALVVGTTPFGSNITQINSLPVASWINGTNFLADVKQFNGNPASGLLTDATHLRSDIDAIGGSATAAANFAAATKSIVNGAVSGVATNVSIPTNLTAADNDHYVGRTIVFVTGTLQGQAATITDYDQPSQTLTVSQLTRAPADTNQFVIV
jgi:hypothetical protein